MKKIGTFTIPLHQPEKAERLIVGYTTRRHLILDFDKTHSLTITVNIIKMVQKDFQFLGDCLICESSWDGYHCIFDNIISWSKIMMVCKVLHGLGILNRNFIKVRTFREDLTLRISSIDRGQEKSEAPKPLCLIPSRYSYLHNLKPLTDKTYSDIMMYLKGIYEYYSCLSAFRSLSNLKIRSF